MPEALLPRRRASWRKVFARCVCLGWCLLIPVGAGASPLLATQKFDPEKVFDRLDTKITLTFNAPADLQTQSGPAHLLSSGVQGEERIEGTFSLEDRSVTATFEVLRGWGEDKSFSVISLANQRFDLKDPVAIKQIAPRTLTIKPDLEATTEKELAFSLKLFEALGSDFEVCGSHFAGEYKGLQVKFGKLIVNQDSLDVQLAVQRPGAEVADATLMLEICNSSGRWGYSGKLGHLRPAVPRDLAINVTDIGDGAVTVILRLDGVAAELSGKARVLEGPEELADLSPNTIVLFSRVGNASLAKVTVDCDGEVILKRLTLLMRDGQSDFLLSHSGAGVQICPPGGFKYLKLIVGACLAFLGLAAAYFRFGPVRVRRSGKRNSQVSKVSLPEEPPEAISSADQISLEGLQRLLSEALLRELAPVKDGISELKSSMAEIRERISDRPDPSVLDLRKEGREDGVGFVSPSNGGVDSGLTGLVNRWWKEGADRTQAGFLLQSRSVKPYRSLDINESLRNLANRTFTFQATDGPIEWLGQQQQEELLIVPCDPRLFETGDSLKFLGLLFEGVSLERSFTKVRFRRVMKPCRLQRDSGFKDRYRLVQRGQIEMEGQAKAASTALGVQPMALTHVPQASSPVPDGMTETRLGRIVKDAVFEALSRDMTVRVEELFRQVGSRLENEHRRAEPAQLDPNLIVSLEAMRKGIAACDEELRAHASVIREVKGLIETLRGDFLRIGSELRHSDSAVPVSQESFFSQPMGVFEVDAALDLLGERPARPLLQESSFDTVAPPWRSVEPVHVLPEEVLDKLDKWWPINLPAAESSPDIDQLPESSTYLWRLEETQKVLARVSRQRGWEVSLVHLGVPDGSAQGDASLLITGPVAVSRDFRSASFRGSSFADALLFQFALSIHGDAGRHIALLPAAGLRVDKHHHAYSRLIPGRLPESAMRLTKVIRPAVLIPAGQGGLYTVASPLKAEFR